MTEYWSGSITFTGLGSGTDFDSIIEAQMSVEEYRLNQLKQWDEQWSSKLELIQDLSTAIASYESALTPFDSTGSFLSKQVSTTNEDVVSATASGDAATGHYTVEVGQIAKNSIVTSTNPWSSADDVVTTQSGTMGIYYGDELFEIDVEAGTTLEDLVTLINSDTGAGNSIRASLVDIGNGDTYLQLTGADLGADNAISVVSTGPEGQTYLPELGSGVFEVTQTAQDAQIRVNGYPKDGGWLERDSNTIDDAIDGLTLSLYKDSPGEIIDITTSDDTSAMYENVQGFVDATNELLAAMAAFDDYSETSTTPTNEDEEITTTFTSVHGNYGVSSIESRLKSIMSSKALGFAYYDQDTKLGDQFTSLSTVGISTETDESSEDFGLLVIDQDELFEAINKDPEAVADLFATSNEGKSHDTTCTYMSSIVSMTEAGDYEVSYTVQGGQLVEAYINGNEAEIDGWTITGKYGNPEQGLMVAVNDQSEGSHTSDVSIKEGIVNSLLNELDDITDSENGTLKIIEDNYKEILKNTSDDIAEEQARLEKKEQRLKEKYATLEATLGQYDDISDTLGSLVDNLGTSS